MQKEVGSWNQFIVGKYSTSECEVQGLTWKTNFCMRFGRFNGNLDPKKP